MRIILKRLAELLLLCFILSPITCALYYYELIPQTDSAYAIVLFCAQLIFIIVTVFSLRGDYFDLCNPPLYFTFNYISYGLFAIITALCYKFVGRVPYAWLFNTLQLMGFSELDLKGYGATIFTHVMMIIAIALAPIGMEWIFDVDDEVFMYIPREDTENSDNETN